LQQLNAEEQSDDEVMQSDGSDVEDMKRITDLQERNYESSEEEKDEKTSDQDEEHDDSE